MQPKLWGFAPLVYSCGEPNWLESAVGWTGTALTLAGLAAAVTTVVAVAAVGGLKRADGIHLVATTLAVCLAIGVVLASRPDQRANLGGAWIYLASFAAVSTLTVVGALGGIIRARVTRLNSKRGMRSHRNGC
jgi:hypothetical protein